jgi:hypothetical protein
MKAYLPSTTDAVFRFSTNAQDGGQETPSAGLSVNNIRVYKNNEDAPRSSAVGFTMTSPSNGLGALHRVSLDLTDDTDAGFWEQGAKYEVFFGPSSATVDGQTVLSKIGEFRILSNSEISAGYQGAVWFDANAANLNSVFGIDGKPTRRVSSDSAALALVPQVGTGLVKVIETMVLTQNWHNQAIFEGFGLHSIVNLNGVDAMDNVFISLVLTGSFSAGDGETIISRCLISSVGNLGGIARNCIYSGVSSIADLGGEIEYTDYFGGSITTQITMSFAGANRKAKFIGWTGDMLVTNMDTVSGNLVIILAGGRVIIDTTCTAGNIIVLGEGSFGDNSGPGCTVNIDGLGQQHWSGIAVKTPAGANMIQADGDERQWTAKALELAPDTPGGDATLANQTTLIGLNNDIKAKTDKLPHSVKRGVELQNFPIQMFDVAGDPLGNVATAVQLMKDGAAYADADNSPATFVSDGTFKLTLTAADLTASTLMLKATAVGARPTYVAILTEEV